MFCTSCGKEISDGTLFCVHCGAKQNVQQAPQQGAQPQAVHVTKQEIYAYEQQQSKKASRAPFIIIGASLIVIIACVIIAFVFVRGIGYPSTTSHASTSSAKVEKSSTTSSGANASSSAASTSASSTAASATSTSDASPSGATPPKFTSVSASSVSTSDDIDSYVPESAIDGDTRTAWVTDGATTGNAAGQWIELSNSSAQHVTGVKIMPGFCKNYEVYTKNRAPREVTFSFSDGSTYTTTLSNKYNEYQTVNFPNAVDTTSIVITINSSYAPTYNGKIYDDCGISEIQVF